MPPPVVVQFRFFPFVPFSLFISWIPPCLFSSARPLYNMIFFLCLRCVVSGFNMSVNKGGLQFLCGFFCIFLRRPIVFA